MVVCIVKAGTRGITDRASTVAVDAGQGSGDISVPRSTTPCSATWLSAPSANRSANPWGFHMLRLQSPLPERYASATPEDLSAWIGTARAKLGDRVFILGHHYQRDDVMRWADARGDSYRLSVLAQQHPEAEYI